MPAQRVLKTRCLKMVTFERHILNVLNKAACDIGKYGEFYFLKSYQVGKFPIMKDFRVTLHYRSEKGSETVWTCHQLLPVKIEEVQEGYEKIFESLLYTFLTDNELWNLISTRLP